MWPVAAAVVLAGNGCAKKADLTAQTAALEKPFPGLAAAVAAQTQATGQPATDNPKACVIAAVCAVRRNNDLSTGVILLRKAARLPGVSAKQIRVMSEVRNAWLNDLASRAGQGDESAKAGLAAIANAE